MPPTFNINPVELTRQIFGIRGYVLSPKGQNKPIEYPGDIPTIEVAEATATSALGTPIYDPVEFLGGTVPGTNEVYDGLQLLDAPLIDITLAKDVVKTKMQGRDGTVKEFMQLNDYVINIRGIFASFNSFDPPYEEIEALNNLHRLPVALDVESKLLNKLGINSLVTTTLKFVPTPRFENIKAYRLTCVSDEAVQLTLPPGL